MHKVGVGACGCCARQPQAGAATKAAIRGTSATGSVRGARAGGGVARRARGPSAHEVVQARTKTERKDRRDLTYRYLIASVPRHITVIYQRGGGSRGRRALKCSTPLGRRRCCQRRERCASGWRTQDQRIILRAGGVEPQHPALALLHAATTSEELFRSGDWKADLAEVLVLAGWRDAKEDFTLYTTTSPSTRRRGRRAAWWCSWRYFSVSTILMLNTFMTSTRCQTPFSPIL